MSAIKNAIRPVLRKFAFGPDYDEALVDRLPVASLYSKPFREELRRARDFSAGLARQDLRSIRVWSTSRGGSHLVAFLFHFSPWAFCFEENEFRDGAEGPAALGGHPAALKASDFMLRSLARMNSIQSKEPAAIKAICYLENIYTPEQMQGSWAEKSNYLKSINIVHLRNPLRLAVSRDQFSAKKRFKSDWVLTEPNFSALMRQEKERCRIAAEMIEASPDNVVLIHEKFCLDAKEAIVSFGRHAGIDRPEEAINGRNFFATYTPFVPNADRLRHRKGGFDPLSPIDVSRVFTDSFRSEIKGDLLKIAEQIFSRRAMDFWLNADRETFQSLSEEQILDAVL